MVIGICGKIASGKSELMKILAKKGFYCIDADKIVSDLYKADGEGAKRIEAVFGKKFLDKDGSVNRSFLREAVFTDENKLKLLNNVIHPIVYEKIALLLRNTDKRKIAIESVYFDEGFLADFVDKIVWVDRSKKEIMNVLKHQRGFNEEMAEKVFELIQKPAKVDFIIVNDAELKHLTNKLKLFF